MLEASQLSQALGVPPAQLQARPGGTGSRAEGQTREAPGLFREAGDPSAGCRAGAGEQAGQAAADGTAEAGSVRHWPRGRQTPRLSSLSSGRRTFSKGREGRIGNHSVCSRCTRQLPSRLPASRSAPAPALLKDPGSALCRGVSRILRRKAQTWPGLLFRHALGLRARRRRGTRGSGDPLTQSVSRGQWLPAPGAGSDTPPAGPLPWSRVVLHRSRF